MTAFNTEDYYQALKNLEIAKLRKAFKFVHDEFFGKEKGSVTSMKRKLDEVGGIKKAKQNKPLTLKINGEKIEFTVLKSSSYEECLEKKNKPNSKITKKYH